MGQAWAGLLPSCAAVRLARVAYREDDWIVVLAVAKEVDQGTPQRDPVLRVLLEGAPSSPSYFKMTHRLNSR